MLDQLDRVLPDSRSLLLLTDPAITDSGTPQSTRRTDRRFTKFRRRAMRRAAMYGRFAGYSTLSAQIGSKFTWDAQVALTGQAYSPSTNSGSISKTLAIGTAAANAAIGGSDEAYSFQQGVAAGASATIDLRAMTDLLQRAAKAIDRIKGFQIRLLSGTDDSTISPVPTITSHGVVTNIGPVVPAPLDFSNGGSGLTVALTGVGAVTAVAIGAAGTLYPKSSVFLASPQQAGGSGCAFAVVTNASGVPTSVVFITGAGGAGYSAATVPTVVVGQFPLYTGGFHCAASPSPTGIVLSATATNILLINTDATNAVTFEIDIIGGTT